MFGFHSINMQYLRDLWRRHRRKVLVTTGVLGSGYFLYNLYDAHKRKLSDLERQLASERENDEFIKAQMQVHFDNIQRIADATTLPHAMHYLSCRIAEDLDFSHLTERLMKGKGQPNSLSSSEKLELWDRLKILSFTRIVVSIWAVTMLSLYSRVQVNILGRHLYIDTARGLGSSHLLDADLIDWDDRQKFLASADFLANYGFPKLISNMQIAATEVLKASWALLHSPLCEYVNLIELKACLYKQMNVMMGILNKFCNASGEKVNFQKSRILVSSNVHIQKAKRLSKQSGIPLTKDFGKYLGAPMIHGRVTNQTYKDILSKAQVKLQAWENKVLSMAGRVTLIKSVLNSLPSYLMQTTFLPEFVISELNKIIRAFLWGDTLDAKKLHLLNWEKVCRPKEEGGLNLRDLRKVNIAYLTKLCWKLLQGGDSLWIEVMRHKYMKNRNLLSIAKKSSDSYTWKSILKGKETLIKGLGMTVNNGWGTKFWVDDWLPCGELISHSYKEISEEEAELTVADYCFNGGEWNLNQLRQYLPSNLIDLVTSILVDRDSDTEDATTWKLSNDGHFDLTSAYKCQLMEAPHSTDFWSKVWDLNCPTKLKLLLWKILLEILPTSTFLTQRKIGSNTICFRCSTSEETALHALRDCASSKNLWLNLNCITMVRSFFTLSSHDWCINNISSTKKYMNLPWGLLFCVTSWYIWYWRNSLLHNQDFVWPLNTVETITSYAKRVYDTLGTYSNRLKYAAFIQWIPPNQNVIKINVDASIRQNPEAAIAGGIARDNTGAWQIGFLYRIGISDVLSAEIWAIFKGLYVSWMRGFRNVILESDSALAVSKISKNVNESDKHFQLITKINKLMRRNWSCSIKFVHREANNAADWLVKNHAPPDTGLHVIEDPPYGVLHCLQADSIGVQRLRLM